MEYAPASPAAPAGPEGHLPPYGPESPADEVWRRMEAAYRAAGGDLDGHDAGDSYSSMDPIDDPASATPRATFTPHEIDLGRVSDDPDFDRWYGYTRAADGTIIPGGGSYSDDALASRGHAPYSTRLDLYDTGGHLIDPDATRADHGIPRDRFGREVDYEGTAILSPERRLNHELSAEADKILDAFGVALENPDDPDDPAGAPRYKEDIARLKELYDLGEDDLIVARVVSPFTDESIVKIRFADGKVVYRHDDYWHDLYRQSQDMHERHRKPFTEGSNVTMWAAGGEGMIRTVLTHHYNSPDDDGRYTEPREYRGLEEDEIHERNMEYAEHLLEHLSRGSQSLEHIEDMHEEMRERGEKPGKEDPPYKWSTGFRAFVDDPKAENPAKPYKELKPERHLAGFRTHERLGRTALYMGFHIVPPMEAVLPDTIPVAEAEAGDEDEDHHEEDTEDAFRRYFAEAGIDFGDPRSTP